MSGSVLFDAPGPKGRRRILVGSLIGAVVLLGVLAWVIWQLDKHKQFVYRPNWWVFTDPGIQRLLLRGYWATIKAAALAIALSLLFGAVFASMRLSDRALLRWVATVVVEFFRAVPLLLLMLFLFLGFADQLRPIGNLVNARPPDAYGAVVIGLTLYNGSVLAEVFRAGIQALPRGQSEAGYALGLRKVQLMRLVLVPQAARLMLPAIVSQCVVALKDSALGFVVGYVELLRSGKFIYNQYSNIIPTAIVVAAMFIITNMALTGLASWLERRTRKVPKDARKVGVTAGEQMGQAATV
jgi:glutamate transport system permease protein